MVTKARLQRKVEENRQKVRQKILYAISFGFAIPYAVIFFNDFPSPPNAYIWRALPHFWAFVTVATLAIFMGLLFGFAFSFCAAILSVLGVLLFLSRGDDHVLRRANRIGFACGCLANPIGLILHLTNVIKITF